MFGQRNEISESAANANPGMHNYQATSTDKVKNYQKKKSQLTHAQSIFLIGFKTSHIIQESCI